MTYDTRVVSAVVVALVSSLGCGRNALVSLELCPPARPRVAAGALTRRGRLRCDLRAEPDFLIQIAARTNI